MSNRRIPAVLGLSLLALAGCDRKPAAQNPAAAPPPTSAASPASPAAPAVASACPSTPQKSAVQDGLHNAMQQIYGIDEVAAKFKVLQITPVDCKNFTVIYRAAGAGAGSPVQTTTVVIADDGTQSVTLFNKQYPIH